MTSPSTLLCLLLFLATKLIAKETYSNIPELNDKNRGSKFISCSDDSRMMRLTEGQYNGTEPINLPLDQQLFIEVCISNLNSCDTSLLSIEEDHPLIDINTKQKFSISGDYYGGAKAHNVTLLIDMTCTPKEKGQTIITITYGGSVIKNFTINVIDPVPLD